MLIVFVSGIDRGTSVYGGCVAVSVLIHYFTLVIWMWMGALAVHMYQKLVVVFVHITTRYIIIASIVCWCKFPDIELVQGSLTTRLCMYLPFIAAVPIVPVVIPLAIDRDFMVTFSPPTNNTTVNITDISNATNNETIRL